MTRVRTLLTSAVLALSLIAVPGCQSNEGDVGVTQQGNKAKLPPPKQMNKESAQDKLREAEQAEKEGKYAHALECYETLRSYPEASRPKDLDERIKRIEARMKAPQ